MQNLLIIAGFVLWIALAFGACALLAIGVLTAFGKVQARYEHLIRADERNNIGNTLVSYSWWFSEDKATMNLIATAGRDLMRGVTPLGDTSVERERWRETRLRASESERKQA